MFLEYYHGNTIIHRLDVRTKVFIFAVFIVLLFLFVNPLVNLGFAVLSTLLVFWIGLAARKIFNILKPVMPIFVIIIVLTGFTYPVADFVHPAARQVLFSLGPVTFTSGGFFYGLTLMFRIYNMVILSSVLTFSTPLDDFLQLMHKARVPRGFSFVVVTGLRFVPTMQKKVNMVFDAQMARGTNFRSGGMIARIRAFIPVMVPLLVQSIYMSENLAVAMLNRGYGSGIKPTPLDEIEMARRDYWFIGLFILVLAAGIYLWRAGAGQL